MIWQIKNIPPVKLRGAFYFLCVMAFSGSLYCVSVYALMGIAVYSRLLLQPGLPAYVLAIPAESRVYVLSDY